MLNTFCGGSGGVGGVTGAADGGGPGGPAPFGKLSPLPMLNIGAGGMCAGCTGDEGTEIDVAFANCATAVANCCTRACVVLMRSLSRGSSKTLAPAYHVIISYMF